MPLRLATQRAVAGNKPRGTPLDAADRDEPAALRDIGGFGRPGGNRSRAWNDQQQLPLGFRRRVAVLQESPEHLAAARVERRLDLDEVPVICGEGPDGRAECFEAGVEFFQPKRGNRTASAQLEDQRHRSCR